MSEKETTLQIPFIASGPVALIGVGLVLGKLFEIDPIASWSWFWVLMPFIFPFVLFIGGVVAVAGIAAVAFVVASIGDFIQTRQRLRRARQRDKAQAEHLKRVRNIPKEK